MGMKNMDDFEKALNEIEKEVYGDPCGLFADGARWAREWVFRYAETNDYKDMRRFQGMYIKANSDLNDLQTKNKYLREALDKITIGDSHGAYLARQFLHNGESDGKV